MKKFQTYDRSDENRHEKSQYRRGTSEEDRYKKSQHRQHASNENGYEKSQLRHDTSDENEHEKYQHRRNTSNENGYVKFHLGHDTSDENGYEKSYPRYGKSHENFQRKHDRYNKDGCEKPQQRYRYNENGYEIPPRQRTGVKNFSKFDSSGPRKDNVSDENMSMEPRKHSHQVERRPKIDAQTYSRAVKDLGKNKQSINITDEHKANYITERPSSKEDNGKIRKGAHPLSPNKINVYPHSKNLNVHDEVFSLNDAKVEYFEERKDSYISEENSLKNRDIDNENSMPFCQRSSTSLYESNLNERKVSYIDEESYSENTGKKNLQFGNENSLPYYQKSDTSHFESNLNEKRDCYINKESSSENPYPKNLQLGIENSLLLLQRSKTLSYESNQNEKRNSYSSEESFSENFDGRNLQLYKENSLLFLQRRNTSYEANQSNAFVHDTSENCVYTQEKKESFQSDRIITPKSSSRANFQGNFASHEGVGFNILKLTDLIYYNANLMEGEKLFEYASVLKSKILEKIDKFEGRDIEELKTLCEISDGDQSEKNQRIISFRACCIIRSIIEEFPLFSNALDPPSPPLRVIFYPTVPSSHATTNVCCNNYDSSVFQVVQNSEMLIPVANYNVMPTYNSAPTARFVVATGSLDSQNNLISSHATTNTYCNNHESPVLEVVQNSKMLTPAINFNVRQAYNSAPTARLIVANEISDSLNGQNSNDHIGNCEAQKLSIDDAKNNSPVNLPLVTKESKDVDESFKRHTSPVNPTEETPTHEFHFDEKKSFFFSLGFKDLLEYDVDKLCGNMVFDYAFSMKHCIIKKIKLNHFMSPYKEKLHFLCQITDGTQREQNQKLINKRMCDLIMSYKAKLEEWNQSVLDEQSENEHQERSH